MSPALCNVVRPAMYHDAGDLRPRGCFTTRHFAPEKEMGTLVTVPLWLPGVGVQQLDHNSEGILAVVVYVSSVV